MSDLGLVNFFGDGGLFLQDQFLAKTFPPHIKNEISSTSDTYKSWENTVLFYMMTMQWKVWHVLCVQWRLNAIFRYKHSKIYSKFAPNNKWKIYVNIICRNKKAW